MSNAILQIQGLRKSFGNTIAVDDLSLEVNEGELFGFLGPNGAGKTTTIRAILGLLHPDGGEIRVFGQKVTPNHTSPLCQVGALLAPPGFLPYLSGYNNLRWLAKNNTSISESEIWEMLELVRLQKAAKRPVRTYSLGMKQRLGIAAALLNHPKLLVLDEPTNGLDPIGMAEMRQLLRGLADQGTTIFLSSHLLHEVEQICDRVGFLFQGHLTAVRSVNELKKSHQDLEDAFLSLIQEAENAQDYELA